jgi:predicted nucleic acid-binding protein
MATDWSFTLPPSHGIGGVIGGAIQHAVTVTRPDPSRAEMAARIMAALAPQCGEYEKFAHMAIDAVAMADALIAALEKAKP